MQLECLDGVHVGKMSYVGLERLIHVLVACQISLPLAWEKKRGGLEMLTFIDLIRISESILSSFNVSIIGYDILSFYSVIYKLAHEYML